MYTNYEREIHADVENKKSFGDTLGQKVHNTVLAWLDESLKAGKTVAVDGGLVIALTKFFESENDRSEKFLRRGYELLDSVYAGHEFDRSLIAEWLDEYNGCMVSNVGVETSDETSRNRPAPVSQVNLQEIKSIMSHIWGNLNDMQDALYQIDKQLSQIDDVATQNASVTKGNSQSDRLSDRLHLLVESCTTCDNYKRFCTCGKGE